MHVEWSDFARDDLVNYISRDSAFYAQTFAIMHGSRDLAGMESKPWNDGE